LYRLTKSLTRLLSHNDILNLNSANKDIINSISDFKSLGLAAYTQYHVAVGTQVAILEERQQALGERERGARIAIIKNAIKHSENFESRWLDWVKSRFSDIKVKGFPQIPSADTASPFDIYSSATATFTLDGESTYDGRPLTITVHESNVHESDEVILGSAKKQAQDLVNEIISAEMSTITVTFLNTTATVADCAGK